jgi:6-phosphofructokinase
MGCKSGFLAMSSVLAPRHVDLCLLPEMELFLERILSFCIEVMAKKGYMVIVVSDGANFPLLRAAGGTEDPSSADVGPGLRDKVMDRFKQLSKPLTNM